jgi:hypothetical protein
MDIPKKASKATAAATGVAIATSGLSNCTNGGAVDPLPPALECNTVSAGQSLTATVTRSADTARVTVRNTEPFTTWRVLQLSNVVGGTIVDTVLPNSQVEESPLVVTIQLAAAAPTQVSFAINAEIRSTEGAGVCGVSRTIMVTVTATTADVVIRGDPLPLPARQRAEIVLVARDGRTVELAARTLYRGESQAQWTVTAGNIVADGSRLRWTLPEAKGMYQAELVVDYGVDGFAIDAMPFEVI